MNHISGPKRQARAMMLPLIAAAPLAAAAIALPATAHAATDFNFHSPSGNIFCDMHMGDDGKSQATCITADHNWVSPPRSRDCADNELWGDALSLYQGEAGFQCYLRLPDDPTAGQTLHYGDTLANGTITCKSEPAGITCTDSGTGHFFRIARESYQLA
ncbi:MAG TPA: DUF6636 domain-containing protein [Mycobacterium sp.]|jgi:Family of unknown function (DUF6636)|nr:DUF6636 domain-containing protein [Mycobacterium sp.]